MIIFPSVAFLAFLLVHRPADGEVVTLKVHNNMCFPKKYDDELLPHCFFLLNNEI